ncbi:MAG: glutamate racemase [Campylobacteraceae bacterium]|jgi:glutamate racemase|nr:glutamate racemase [Campylobacteraceae bacterium]
MRVGVFDSGVGGLTVTKSLIEHRLFDEIIYFGDTARVPYGTKDSKTIIKYSLEALDFLKSFDIDMLIVACNTASAYALEELRKNASFEVFGVIEPGVLATINALSAKNSSILILGTKATISSGQYQKLLLQKGYENIISLAPSLFVPIVEEGLFDGDVLKSAIKHYFKDIKQNPDAIILGCTHFPLIAKAIGEYFPNSILVHSGDAIVEYLRTKHRLCSKTDTTTLKLLASDNLEGVKKTAKTWLCGLI